MKFKADFTKLNFISNLCAFFISYSISFFLSPYIVGILGEDAYGFVSLSSSFTNYISLATVALNSLASRFVSVAIYNKDYEKAQKYYTSVIIANTVIAAVLIVPILVFVINLEKIIYVPVHLVTDVKILFGVVFAGFFISLITSLFSVAVFVENKLYLTAICNAICSIIKLILTIALFLLLPAKICYVGIVAIITNIFVAVWQKRYMRKYLPMMKVRFKFFDIKKIVELIKSGVWSLVSQLSGIMNSGLDLLLANQFINSVSMGVLSIASTLPTIIQSVLGSVSSSFTPNLTKHYAEEKYDMIVVELRRSVRMMSLVLIIPMAGMTVFGGDFYALWQPTQDSQTLQILSVLKILCIIFTGCMAAVHEIFVVANKLKLQSIATLISGVANIVIVYIILKNSNWGIYAIAGVSSVIAIIRNFVFTFPYVAKCIGQKWYTFYLMSLKSAGIYAIICLAFAIIRYGVGKPTTWIQFIIECIFCGAAALILVIFIFLNKTERSSLIRKFIKKKETV